MKRKKMAENNTKYTEAMKVQRKGEGPKHHGKKSGKAKKDAQQQPKERPKGAVLKEARLAKGISLDSVHENTKIPLDALRAIEEGYEVRTLSPFYIKGFTKIYAKYLGIEITDIVDDYRHERLPQYIKSDYKEFDWKEWLSAYLTPQRKRLLLAVAVILFGLFLFFKFLTFLIHSVTNRPKRQKTVEQQVHVKPVEIVQEKKEAKESDGKERTPAPAPKPKAEPPKPAVPVAAPVKVTKNVTLTVRAKKESWLRVMADEEIVFQRTLPLGSVETWIADKQIEISGRNLNELEFELNGKMIGTLGRKDRNAKRLIITKDGLTVTK